MRTGKDLVRATKPFATDSSRRSWWVIGSTLGLLASAVAVIILKIHPGLAIGCSLLAGLLALRLFVLYHDQQHHALLAHSRLAEWLMRGVGILLLSPSSVWRSSHNYHHKHNSKLRSAHIGSYPVMTKAEYLRSSPARRRGYLLIRHPLTILFGYASVFLWGMCLYPFINQPREHRDGLIAFLAHIGLALALAWAFGWMTMLLALVVPIFIAAAIGAYLFYAQHNFPQVSFYDRDGWAYEKAALESSSFMKMGPVMNWFSANIGYHHIHHLNARIPYYRLPETFAAIPELKTPKTTSLHLREIYRCLRLKVWDVEAQRMVALSELKHSPRAVSA